MKARRSESRERPDPARRDPPLGGRRGKETVREIRWFTPGPLPELACPPDARFEDRIDLYHLPSLSTRYALKRRGTGEIELKRRARAPRPVTYLRLPAVAEDWRKVRLAAVPDEFHAGHWVPVQKRVWQRAGYELAEVRLEDDVWWTLAVRERHGSFGKLPQWLRPLVELVGDEACSSYPAWLLQCTGPLPSLRRQDRSAS